MTGSHTKHQGTPRRQPKHCNNNWIAYPCGVTTPDLSSVQTRQKHCGALLTTEQQANQCQQLHLMELWLNEQVMSDTLGSTLTLSIKVRHEDSAEVEAVTHTLLWIASRGDSRTTHAILLTDSCYKKGEVEWEAQTGMCRWPTPTFENSCGCTALDIPE